MRDVMIDPLSPQPELIQEAARIIRDGGLAIVPTDTVYGVAGVLNDSVVARIFAAKKRPAGKGLIAMIADLPDIALVCESVPSSAEKLIAGFWPGPLTLVLKAARNIPTKALVKGKIGVRMPDHQVLRDLIRAVGVPLATTSANLSGRPSPVDPARGRADLGDRVDLIIDSGPCPGGVESTVVDVMAQPAVLRLGAISESELMEVLHQHGD